MLDNSNLRRPPFDVTSLMPNVEEEIRELTDTISTPTTTDGVELSRLSIFIRNSDKQSLFTFIELEGYPILRISLDGQSHDLILNNDQVKLLLRQMTLWLTR